MREAQGATLSPATEIQCEPHKNSCAANSGCALPSVFACVRKVFSCFGMALLALLFLFAPMQATAVTYSNVATTFSWIDASTHTQVGYNTAPYKFNNTGGCGTTPPVLDDTLSDNIPIGFTFMYGGVNFTSVRIMSNGRLQFNNNTACGYGSPVTQLPYPDASLTYSMRIYGNDLDPTLKSDVSGYSTVCTSRTTCYVSYATLGTSPNRTFVVTWSNVPEWTNTSTAGGGYNLQVILQENGEFIYQFGSDTPGPGNVNAQIGWEVSTSDYAVPNIGFPANNSAIRFYIPSPISELRMDEGVWSGAGAVVNSSGGTNGTPVGAAQTVSGGKLCRGGNVPSNTFTSTIDAVDTGYDVDSQIGSSGAITFWYKSNVAWSGGVSQDSQLFDATVVNNKWFYFVKRSVTGQLSFNLTDNANNNYQINTGNNAFAANTWVHIAVTWNLTPVAANNRLQIYVNGALVQTVAIGTTQPLSAALGTLYMGDNRSSFVTSPGTGNSANGVIDEVRIYNYEASSAIIWGNYNATRTCPSVDHYELSLPTSSISCLSTTVTVNACADASSPCTNKSTILNGQVATLSSSAGSLGTTTPTFDATGVATTTLSYPAAINGAPASVTLSAVQSAASSPGQCCPNGTSCIIANGCSTTFNTAGFIFSGVANGAVTTIPAQVAGTSSNTYYLRAVQTNTTTKACQAALTGASPVNFAYECNNPSTCFGSNLMSVSGGTSTVIQRNNNGSVSGYVPVNMNFDANGNAPFIFNYGDVGQVKLYASKAASGLLLTTLTGVSNSLVVAPSSFVFSGITAGPIKASNFFNATVSALTSTGVVTPNFGKETIPEGVALTFTKFQPTGSGAANGTFYGSLGSFSGGIASGSNLNWSEVGTIDLIATLASGSYLGSGLTATGTTGAAGAVGRFIPDHFDTVVTQGCNAGGFTYSGQPFTVQVIARNLGGGITQNYDGTTNTVPNFSRTVTLSDANSVASGSLAPTSVTASAFTAGVASPTPAFTFTSKQSAPATIMLHATDTDSVVSSTTQGTANIRSGRIRMQNAHGSELLPLTIPVTVQYWNGSVWVTNTSDICTTLVAANVAFSFPAGTASRPNNLAACGTAATITGSSPNFSIALSKPGAGKNGWTDLTINLGATAAGNTCTAVGASSPSATTASEPWLQYNWQGSIGNPTARATFGIFKNANEFIYMRENY